MTNKIQHLHLVSDSTGETINAVTRACLAQFENTDNVQEHYWSLIRSKRQLDMVMEGIRQWPGMILYTFVDEELRRFLVEQCRILNIPNLSVLDPVMKSLSVFLEQDSAHKPGRQHVLDADYFDRIDAMDFAMAQDDGNKTQFVEEADVLLLGVSRTSKTPTCIYLANRGIRAANIPIVPGVPLPVDIATLERPLVVGLTTNPEKLVEIRRNRLRFLQENDETSYVDIERVEQEVIEARRLFARIGCPVIDVSRRSIEETAAEIMMLLNKRELAKAIEKNSLVTPEQSV